MKSEFRVPRNDPFTCMLDPQTLRSIKKTLRKQVDFETSLSFDEFGHSPVSDTDEYRLGFNIHSLYAAMGARSLPNILRIYDSNLEGTSVVDVGGANPSFLNTIAEKTGANFEGTFTSLSDFPQEQDVKFQYRKMAAEMPPAEFYKKFDIVISMNGPLVWSAFPELSLKNLIKMVKSGGFIFLGIHRNLYERNFSPSSQINRSSEIESSTPLFLKENGGDGVLEYIFAQVK